MPLTSKNELFTSPWGMVEHRRKEIEDGPFGTFERVLKEETNQSLLGIRVIAERCTVSESTARKWLADHDARYVVEGQAYLYFAPDIEACDAARKARAA